MINKKALGYGLQLLYGWGTWIRTKEMPDSESGALPLGYTPIFWQHDYSNVILVVCQEKYNNSLKKVEKSIPMTLIIKAV